MAVVIPYLVGVVTAPLVAKAARGTVKAAIGVGLQAKKLAAEAAEDFQDLAMEANAEMAAARAGTGSSTIVTERKKV
ncbi:MAG: DUF5132 domain-containing protein [Pseudonocardiaceae bacterium]